MKAIRISWLRLARKFKKIDYMETRTKSAEDTRDRNMIQFSIGRQPNCETFIYGLKYHCGTLLAALDLALWNLSEIYEGHFDTPSVRHCLQY